MKKKLTLLICVVLALCLCACGDWAEETPENVTEQIIEEEKVSAAEGTVEGTEEMIPTEDSFAEDETSSVTEPPATEPPVTEPIGSGTILPDIEL